MIQKLLIANRGEIACRIIKTAQRMGIRTVAVYSTADANARHVRWADEAFAIGGAESSASYLVIENIINVAKMAGAQAIHPGYGFLSENAEFAKACVAAGLIFVGPPAEAIVAMGLKSESKQLMAQAGVPLIPGYHGGDQTPELLLAEADRMGYPVLIKASAGGGGKGMRVVNAHDAFLSELASCQREAEASFGNAKVLIEKYLHQPRHIEIQVFADQHGHCVHLYERDCSMQRRHQKVIEEAPAPNLSAELCAKMAQTAILAAKSVNYVGAGTVEFIVEPSGAFYFMEMNTRLQVEHPVTEMITGVDLVEWQLRVAAGEPLPLTQAEIPLNGHALEVRIYAEDADHDFLPSAGTLTHLSTPEQSTWVRIDSGVEQGDVISAYYDPMIAKLIVWEPSQVSPEDGSARRKACQRMLQALADFRVVGVTHNLPFLTRLVAHPAFLNAQLDTGFIERERATLIPSVVASPPIDVYYLAALMEMLWAQQRAKRPFANHDPHSPWSEVDHWRLNALVPRPIHFRQAAQDDNRVTTVWVQSLPQDPQHGEAFRLSQFQMHLSNSPPIKVQGRLMGDTLHAVIGDRRQRAVVIASNDKRLVFHSGTTTPLILQDPQHDQEVATQDDHSLIAPMSGKIISHCVAVGTLVKKGDSVLILSAMKMEYTLSAPGDGTIEAYCYAEGEQVSDGALLVAFVPNA